MSYGLTIDQVRQINEPQSSTAPWGRLTPLTEMPQFSMFRVDIIPGAAQPLHIHTAGSFHAFVEDGAVIVRSLDEVGKAEAAIAHPAPGRCFDAPRIAREWIRHAHGRYGLSLRSSNAARARVHSCRNAGIGSRRVEGTGT